VGAGEFLAGGAEGGAEVVGVLGGGGEGVEILGGGAFGGGRERERGLLGVGAPGVGDEVLGGEGLGEKLMGAEKFEVVAEGGEEGAGFGGVLISEGEEGGESGREICAEGEEAEAGGVGEFEVGVVGAEFVPEAVDAEVGSMDGGVVEEDDGGGRELGAPSVEVMADRGIVVEAVEMEEIDGAIGEAGEGGVESGLEEGGEGGVGGVVGAEVFEDRRRIRARLGITSPSVDGGGMGVEVEVVDGLKEGAVGVAMVRAEFDEGAGAEEVDEEESEGDVADPGGGFGEEVRGLEKKGVVEGVEGGGPACREGREAGRGERGKGVRGHRRSLAWCVGRRRSRARR
jgi:hypothetical protein